LFKSNSILTRVKPECSKVEANPNISNLFKPKIIMPIQAQSSLNVHSAQIVTPFMRLIQNLLIRLELNKPNLNAFVILIPRGEHGSDWANPPSNPSTNPHSVCPQFLGLRTNRIKLGTENWTYPMGLVRFQSQPRKNQ